jgi:hypothetical protein
MKRTTVMLPVDLKARAMRAARERGISFGELLRRSLAATLESPAPAYDDPVFADTAVFDGETPEDLAAGHDGYLYGNDG